MSHMQGCLLCGAELEYTENSRELDCAVCGNKARGTATCSRGHYVCDRCHTSNKMELIERVCTLSATTDPVVLATELMMSPSIAMHGPEHHFLVPAVLLATYDNVMGQPEKKAEHLAEARRRAELVPGGFCGTHGNCGAGVGAGIFWSVATGATPLATQTWGQANRLTARSLLRIADHGGPRCCKRDTWHSLLRVKEDIGAEVLATGWSQSATLPVCSHSSRNKHCLLEQCQFHPTSIQRKGLEQAGEAHA